mmetsp:Transcript_14332/g.28616  ORF Transcript_14332/g.28616 Transcript_14332/m.28616 type:complete len:224 (+) Transcript_14332:1217-1888(+)
MIISPRSKLISSREKYLRPNSRADWSPPSTPSSNPCADTSPRTPTQNSSSTACTASKKKRPGASCALFAAWTPSPPALCRRMRTSSSRRGPGEIRRCSRRGTRWRRYARRRRGRRAPSSTWRTGRRSCATTVARTRRLSRPPTIFCWRRCGPSRRTSWRGCASSDRARRFSRIPPTTGYRSSTWGASSVSIRCSAAIKIRTALAWSSHASWASPKLSLVAPIP